MVIVLCLWGVSGTSHLWDVIYFLSVNKLCFLWSLRNVHASRRSLGTSHRAILHLTETTVDLGEFLGLSQASDDCLDDEQQIFSDKWDFKHKWGLSASWVLGLHWQAPDVLYLWQLEIFFPWDFLGNVFVCQWLFILMPLWFPSLPYSSVNLWEQYFHFSIFLILWDISEYNLEVTGRF